MAELTQTQRQFLRKIAHDLKPIVHIGRQGLSPSVVDSVDEALEAHELIKAKFQDHQSQKQELTESLAETLRCEIIGIVGNVAILYRECRDPEKRKVRLPRG